MWWQQSWRIASKHSESLISSQTERNFSKLSPPTRVTYVMKAICKVPPIGCNWKHGGSSSACTVYARAMCAYAFLWRRSCEIQVGETDEWLPLSVEREREKKKIGKEQERGKCGWEDGGCGWWHNQEEKAGSHISRRIDSFIYKPRAHYKGVLSHLTSKLSSPYYNESLQNFFYHNTAKLL